MKSSLIIPLQDIKAENTGFTGGKAMSLGKVAGIGLTTAFGVCITTEAYRRYLSQNDILNSINLELSRKSFNEMRWEEIWDLSLRVRNLFIRTPITSPLLEELKEGLSIFKTDRPLVVRSSSTSEDGKATSYAGLHESFVNVKGTSDVLESIRLVWASLWSDRALLYRQELGLDLRHSAMAVVVQELISGHSSGIVFSQSPVNKDQMAVEAVHGLNQGLVDGSVEPDRWFLGRTDGQVLTHQPSQREKTCITTGDDGVKVVNLSLESKNRPPLTPKELKEVYDLAMSLENYFTLPQDVEFTFSQNELYCLQSRPITVLPESSSDDKRPWYLTLERSFSELEDIGKRIEEELLPGMTRAAEKLALTDPGALDDGSLEEEIRNRAAIVSQWEKAYYKDCIPFAHGMRLFGSIYNDVIKPRDPHEFMVLLTGTSMLTTERNHELVAISRLIHQGAGDDVISENLDLFLKRFGKSGNYFIGGERDFFLNLAKNMAKAELPAELPAGKSGGFMDAKALEENFITAMGGKGESEARTILKLARASYRLRDEDNLYLGAVEYEFERFLHEGRIRWSVNDFVNLSEDVRALLKKSDSEKISVDEKTSVDEKKSREFLTVPRQLLGQPASPGLAEGPARIVLGEEDLATVRAGDVIVCDSIKPTMTFVVPLVAAIVERRGGMLIHGAIIAREYKIPCVTGIPDAASVIEDGDHLIVDGHLGIVRVSRE